MPYQFNKHYSRDEARALLPQVREWLNQLLALRREVETAEQTLRHLLDQGWDTGGALANRWVRTLVRLQDIIVEFYRREDPNQGPGSGTH